MSPLQAGLRTPLVTGLAPGIGTSTVAAALHADDGGRVQGAADIVVCASTPSGLDLATALVIDEPGPRPVLALVGSPSRARLRTLEARFTAVVVLPVVARWHGLPRPAEEVTPLLGQRRDLLPRPVRGYAAAMHALAAAVLESGQLRLTRPPAVTMPVPVHVPAVGWSRGPHAPGIPPAGPAVDRAVPRRPAGARPPLVRSAPVRPVVARAATVRPISVRPTAVRPTAVRPTAVRPTAVRPPSTRFTDVRPAAAQPAAVRPTAVRPALVITPASTMPTPAPPGAPEPDDDTLERLIADLASAGPGR